MSSPTGFLFLTTHLPTELHTEFSQWCDGHHQELLRVPGFLRARRFHKVDSPFADAPQFLTLYELESPQVLLSDDYAESRNWITPIPENIKDHLKVTRRDLQLIDARPDDWFQRTNETSLLDVFSLRATSLKKIIEFLPSVSDDVFSRAALRFTEDFLDPTTEKKSTGNDPILFFDHDEEIDPHIDAIADMLGSARDEWEIEFIAQAGSRP